ncbi:MAG TPA: NifB/NifX family molybdenum-iron cluster-binding protein [Draconibacterium sp.]|nr:NifB/NifX family molybdenum-iron cluster-binding protein [Draconibacterium sp.]HRX12370.1 NifB/NifX family molybdenum-iron cluster-binding protein [Draconibacterium sp.]
MNKIFAITSTGKTEKSFMDLRFGKCENVVIFNVVSNQYSVIENPFKESENSGIQLIGYLKELEVTSIITGEVGPKVSALLENEKIQLILLPEERIKVEEIMDRINP